MTTGLLDILGFEDVTRRVDPANAREDTVRALGVYVNALAASAPVVLQIGDLQWADDALLELIDEVIADAAHRRVVLVGTARPEILSRWRPALGRHNSLLLHLDPLDRSASARLLDELASGPLTDDVVAAVLDRSGGNPFFLEELVSLIDDPSAEPVADLPATLRGLVSARLDALEPGVRALLQDASVLGQHGPVAGLVELVRHRHGDVMGDFDALLGALVDEGILDADADRWSFRSDLVREVAYQTVTKADRAKAHRGIAVWLEKTYGDRRPRPPWLVDQLSHHYGAAVTLASELGGVGSSSSPSADLPSRARRWAVAAAAKARRDQAMPTAIQHYDRALVLADLDPSATDIDRADLHVLRADAAVEAWDLRVAAESVEEIDRLSPPGETSLRAAALAVRGRIEQKRGHGDAAIEFLVRAEDMYARLGMVPESSATARHLALVQIFEGRVDDAERSAERARAGFEVVGDADGQGWAFQHLAWISFVRGDRERAHDRIADALVLFDEARDSRGQAWAKGLEAWILFQANRAEEASELAQDVLAEARSRREPWATAMMTLLLGSVRLWLGRTDEAVELAHEAKRAFTGLEDAYGLLQATGVLGRSLVMAGRIEEGEENLASLEDPVFAAARILVAAQLGEPGRVAGFETVDSETVFGDELRVARGVLALQRGDLRAAEPDLMGVRDSGAEGEARSFRRAASALWLAAAGKDGAAEIASALDDERRATYLDRSVAHLAAALRAGAVGDPAAARRHLDQSRSTIETTGDRIARHLHRLVATAIAERLGGDVLGHDAVPGRRWSLPGLESDGWRRLIAGALEQVPGGG